MNILASTPIKICSSALCVLLSVSRPASAGDIYKTMANEIARYSATNKVKNIAVLSFSRKARTSREESEYVSERLLTCLVNSGKVNMLERGQLDKVLQEHRLSQSGISEEGGARKEGAMPSTDAIIIGMVFGTRDHLKIIAKMIDSQTGAVLHIIEAETERQWDMVSEHPDFEFEMPDPAALAGMFGEEAKAPSFADFRDAPASGGAGGCVVLRSRLAVRQASTVEAKAKYWALRMRDPDFSSSVLTRNPGAEISDPQVKRRFYRLLDEFYRAAEAPVLSAKDEEAVSTVMEEERKAAQECGLL
ncbi:MAG: CsgG/HfaB family protein [Elusimicrobiales bacterium]